MTAGTWRRALLGRAVRFAQKATPRLEAAYTRLPAATGLTPGQDVAEHEARLLRYFRQLTDRVADLPVQPTFSFLVAGGSGAGLDRTLASIGLQLYPRWQVCVSGAEGAAAREVARFQQQFGVQVRSVPGRAGYGPSLQAALESATGEYVIVVDPGDRLYPQALAELVRAFDLEVRLGGALPVVCYSDEHGVDEDGTGGPLFKPGWSPLLLRSGDYLGSLTCVQRTLATEAGGFREVADPRHDLALRVTRDHAAVHIPHILCQRPTKPRQPTVPASLPTSSLPPATVVIPTKDQGSLLRRCLDSLLSRTDYPDLAVVLVDNGTRQPEALAVLDEAAGDDRVTVLRRPGPFNFARLCNAGAALAHDGVLVLLNNDTEVVAPGWLRALVQVAVEPGVGAVGAQLRYPDGKIQHAGIAGLGDAGTGHLFLARDPARETPLSLAQATREVLAVTGACLAIRAELFAGHGGMDEHVVPIDSGDIDLCLRLRDAGLVSAYAPEAVLIHHESPSRRSAFHDFERFYLRRRWPGALLNDPYLNPHLARSTKYVPDARFGFPDVPAQLLDRWSSEGLPPF